MIINVIPLNTICYKKNKGDMIDDFSEIWTWRGTPPVHPASASG
jgi:hypothetical protein